jgi:SAM-dependent methyltransferase
MPTMRGAARRLKRVLRPSPPAVTPDSSASGATEVAEPVPAPPWYEAPPSPWQPYTVAEANAGAFCPICRWTGLEFEGVAHAESALCPRCGSIARDRLLFWCYVQRTPESLGARVLETSPRLGREYRDAMGTWFAYTCSDYDLSAHRGVVQLDLQEIDLPDASVDAILTPHVLEHVPETDKALGEVFRILAPGGRMYLQVPVLQGATAPPVEPEFHGDNTPVFWRFGFDLTARLREHGFETSLLATQPWIDLVASGASDWPEEVSGEFDVASMLEGVVADDLTAVANRVWAERLGVVPAYQFLTWECIKAS